MEVLVLVDFEGTMADEITVHVGDVVKNVKASEKGWLEGELNGKRGIFPANFVKEVPLYLRGNSKREPRGIRTTQRKRQARQCEVLFPYNATLEDELELVVGETIEIVREIEDGWLMGLKNGKVGAFPSNFVKEIPIFSKNNEGKTRPKLTDAVFNKEMNYRTSARNKSKSVIEYCQVMFDYEAKAEDELALKAGDVVVLLRKEAEDEGWWEGELNGRRGFFPDNFVMVIPPMDSLTSGSGANQRPARNSVKKPADIPAMDRSPAGKTKDDKPEIKDLRSNPPTKVKLPSLNKPSPPPVKDKPQKITPKSNGEVPSLSPKKPEEKNDQFDGIEVQTDKLSHPTANRAKPPQRRPPSALITTTQNFAELSDSSDSSPKKVQIEKLPSLPKATENLIPAKVKPDRPKTPPSSRPVPPKILLENKNLKNHKEEATVQSLQAEIKELRMALELLQTRHERDIQEVKEELKEERNKRMALQEDVLVLKMKK